MKRVAAVAAVAAAAGLFVGHAEAQPRSSGAVDAAGLFGRDVWGGALTIDVWAALAESDAVRVGLGGAIGGAALTSDDDARSRILMPLGASASLFISPSGTWFLDFRARGGMWGGATNQGLAAGGWVAGSAYFGYALGPNASLGLGATAWGLLGHGSIFAVGPAITAVWTPSEY